MTHGYGAAVVVKERANSPYMAKGGSYSTPKGKKVREEYLNGCKASNN